MDYMIILISIKNLFKSLFSLKQLTSFIIVFLVFGNPLKLSAQEENIQYQPSWESIGKHECPEWFRDAKFGIFMEWPGNNELTIKSLLQSGLADNVKITNVELLGSKETIQWQHDKNGLSLKLPNQKPCNFAYVL